MHYHKVGDIIQKKQHSLLNKAGEACKMLKEHIENDSVIRLISHNDADGISAAAVIANALKEEDVQFHTTILPRLKEENVNQLRSEKYDLFIFSDMGSPFIKDFNTYKQRSRRQLMVSRWRCWCRPRFWRCSTIVRLRAVCANFPLR